MNTGLLWYDGSKRSLEDKVTRAAIRFRDKYGLGWPDTCYVHPQTLGDRAANIAVKVPNGNGRLVIRCLPSPTMLKSHLWLGRKEQEEAA